MHSIVYVSQCTRSWLNLLVHKLCTQVEDETTDIDDDGDGDGNNNDDEVNNDCYSCYLQYTDL